MGVGVEVLKDRCISTGNCVADAPSVFGFDADGLAEVVGDPAALAIDELTEVARLCPAAAIRLLGDVTVPAQDALLPESANSAVS